MTENEMRDILIDIRKKYVPDQSFDFIHQLSWEYLEKLLDLIATKDPWEQEKKWKDIEDKMHVARISINMIFQKAKVMKIQVDEKKDQKGDVASIEDVEKNF